MAPLVTFSNAYASCTIADHSRDKRIVGCVTASGRTTRNFVHNDQHAACEFHHCVVLEDPTHDDIHNVLSCTGAIMRFDDDNFFFNPLTPLAPKFSAMKSAASTGAISLDDTSVQYYYKDDVRTVFHDNILGVTCKNDLKTCVRFHNGTACFGNVDETPIIHASSSLIVGVVTAFTFAAGRQVFFRNSKGLVSHVLYFFAPLLGTGLIFLGSNMAVKFPYFLGNYVMISLFAFIALLRMDFGRPQTHRYDAVTGAP